nr:hypothetical protein [Paenibacillus aquistagni]
MQEQWRVFLAVPLPAELKLKLHHELQLTPSVLESLRSKRIIEIIILPFSFWVTWLQIEFKRFTRP